MAKYDKEKIIGNGSYGNVWLVRSQVNKDIFVMKEIKLNSMNAAEQQQAMMEATLLSKCRHKNIIKYKEAITDRPRRVLQIVMEYAEGGDLYSAIIKQKGVPFKEHTVMSWFIQICLALQYIHFQNILHRDLKTQNIFLTLNNVIKVGDFGIARVLKEPTELATTAIGTPYYLSPEICQRKPYNYKSDMWALGCILFEMSALVHPFQAFSFPHLLTLILKGKKKELPKHCSPLICELINSLLSVNPNKRPSTDQILAKPELQPYLSEYLTLFNNDLISTHKQKMNERRHSLNGVLNDVKDLSLKRRASVSLDNSRAVKARTAVSTLRKEALKMKHSISFRYTKKSFTPQPLTKGINTDRKKNTYRVISPKISTLLKSSSNTLGSDDVFLPSCSSTKSPLALKKTVDGVPPATNNESDYGYQSEETSKTLTTKTRILFNKISSKDSNVSTLQLGKKLPGLYNIFASKNSHRKNIDDEGQSSATHCQHSSECHQCMFNMLWQNRIRGPAGISGTSSERVKFENKLKELFGEELFEKLYEALYSRWETRELEESKDTVQSIIDSLNYKQIQSLPLMMQLIQLDILKKYI